MANGGNLLQVTIGAVTGARLELHQVICGDSLESVRRMGDRSIGMVMTDPPFFINIGQPDTQDAGTDPWTEIASIESAARWAEPLMREFARVVRPGGAVVLMAGPRASAAWILAAESAGLTWMAEIVVLWSQGKPRARKFGSLHTHLLWFSVPGARHAWNTHKRAIYSNIIVCQKVPRSLMVHPAQKPVELTTFLISLLSRSGDVVLDPFCGSGSTLVSAELCGRAWIGIDQEERNCRIARRRVTHAEVEEENRLYLWINGGLEEV